MPKNERLFSFLFSRRLNILTPNQFPHFNQSKIRVEKGSWLFDTFISYTCLFLDGVYHKVFWWIHVRAQPYLVQKRPNHDGLWLHQPPLSPLKKSPKSNIILKNDQNYCTGTIWDGTSCFPFVPGQCQEKKSRDKLLCPGTKKNVKIPSRPVPKQHFELVPLSHVPGTIKELLSLCPKKLHCPVSLETLVKSDIEICIESHDWNPGFQFPVSNPTRYFIFQVFKLLTRKRPFSGLL